jgi:hypothetical protein
MIGALVGAISLYLTTTLVGAGQVAGTFPVSGATTTSPIALTSTAHGVPLGRVVHGVVAGVGGISGASGTFILTPTDANTFTLSSYDAQGNTVASVGTGAYTSGGTISYAFPDWQILLGRQMLALGSAVASPRIVFIPTGGRAWGLEPYGGSSLAPSAEVTAEQLEPQLATSYPTFEIYVTGAANPPSPSFGDFDATQAVVDALYGALYDTIGPARARILRDGWPSQSASAGTQTQRGQQWMGVLEVQHPVTKFPLLSATVTSIQYTVETSSVASGDVVTFHIP